MSHRTQRDTDKSLGNVAFMLVKVRSYFKYDQLNMICNTNNAQHDVSPSPNHGVFPVAFIRCLHEYGPKHGCDQTNQVKPTLNLIPTASLDIQIAVEKAWQPKQKHLITEKNFSSEAWLDVSFHSEIFFYQNEVLVRCSSLKDIWYLVWLVEALGRLAQFVVFQVGDSMSLDVIISR